MESGTTLARRAAAYSLAILTLINLFNYLDRYVVAALAESLKRSELHLSDARLGLLMTGFVIVYMLTSPIFGTLGDRKNRPRLIGAGVAVWSLATGLGGLARNFAALLSARSAVGVGEAAYGTISPALLADAYPEEKRGRVFSIFFAAIPVGSAAGYIAGGLLDHWFGWRAAFFAAGVPGLLLAFLAWRLPDPPRRQADRPALSAARSYAMLWKNRPYRAAVAGYAAYTFALGGIAFWMPAFLERVRHVPPEKATVQFGAIVVATGFAGSLGGGWIADRLRRRLRAADFWVSGATALAAAPPTLLALTAPRPSVYLPAIVAAELLLFLSTGPINSAIVSVVDPAQRATAVAASILAIHLLGDVPSPPLIGALSDASGLERAVRIVPVAVALAGIIWLAAGWRIERRKA